MQHPLMRVLEGGRDTRAVSGRDILIEISAVLDEKLPLVTASDPSLTYLRDLRAVLAASQLTPRRPERESR